MSAAFGLGLKSGHNQDDYAKVYSAATGIECDGEELLSIGEKIYMLEIAYNIREGLKREHFVLPDRFTQDPIAAGKQKGKVADTELLEAALDRYFEARGIDPATVRPTREGLERVGLKDVADDLDIRGLLAK